MNTEYLALFMDKTAFPAEAKEFLLSRVEPLNSAAEEAFRSLTERYLASAAEEVEQKRGYGYAVKAVEEQVNAFAEQSALSPYTMWLLLLIAASAPVREDWAGKGRPESLFWDTFSDIRYKALECKRVQGVWGNFVAHWYAIFYTDRIFKLGRLEYELSRYERDEPYEGHGIRLEKGDPVLNIHIPSSGERFDLEARLESYKRAYDFFSDYRKDGILPCVCHSWLLYPDYAPLLVPGSNILSFQQDFEIIGKDVYEEFGDDWRLFGADSKKPLADWPEDTRMQRSFKEYFLGGGKPGAGFGVLFFNGERLLTRQQP